MEENEGPDEGGMLCILNAQTPVRWVEKGPDISIGFGSTRDKAKTAMSKANEGQKEEEWKERNKEQENEVNKKLNVS